MHRCLMFNYANTKKSLIAFQNDDQDELFKYYDTRNNTRLKKLGVKATITKELTHTLKELGSSLLSILKKISSTGKEKGTDEYKKQEKRGETYDSIKFDLKDREENKSGR